MKMDAHEQPVRAEPLQLPPPLFNARGQACWIGVGLLTLVVASFWTLDLQWAQFLSLDAARSMGRFLAEFFPPDLNPKFLRKVAWATVETLAMSALGTLLAALMAAGLALLASRPAGWTDNMRASRLNLISAFMRCLLNALRSIPELVWAALLLISAGLGPFAGTLALALHTSGVLGRLFTEALENAPPGPSLALGAQGVGGAKLFFYALLPQVLPQWVSYALYRWENNIRAAAVLGVVGAGGLGQLLSFHMGLFHMGKTATILAAMLLLVALVDAASDGLRRRLMR
ncbi:MAG: Phosphate-import permease protein PhnE [Pseudomonadota bacterium]|jgi:phosphonate transport system permease protein